MSAWSSVPSAAAALATGNFVVVVDAESRENEGDLVMAAQFVTNDACAFMVEHTNGILCVPMTEQRATELELPMMVSNNEDRNGTAFTITCDAAVGTSTGASAADRAHTIRLLSSSACTPTDLNRPGHLFPLAARNGGILERGGHTEASVDLCLLAGCRPVALICELMHRNGTMMRRQSCLEFAREHKLEIITTQQLADYRRVYQNSVSPARPIASVVVADEKQLLQRAEDEKYMNMALQLAYKGRMSAPPNPWVGCVLVKNGSVIGTGFHHKTGEAHAEVVAIADASRNGSTHGCTAYTTLEPCSHMGRTGPCDRALIDAGVSRVVISIEDPDPRVRGAGIATLRAAGIETVVGVCGKSGLKLLEPYVHNRCASRPYCVLKAALSLDGKIACADDTSQWITGPEARADGHMIRAMSQAILVGSHTVLEDNPRLTTRIPAAELSAQGFCPPAHPLLRVVLDSKGRVLSGPLLDCTAAPTLVFTSMDAPQSSLRTWAQHNVDVCVVPYADTADNDTAAAPSRGGRLSLTHVVQELGRRGIIQLLIEGGSDIHTSFLRAGLVDKIVMYKGSTVLGKDAKPWLSEEIARTITDANFWQLKDIKVFGNDVRMEYDAHAKLKTAITSAAPPASAHSPTATAARPSSKL